MPLIDLRSDTVTLPTPPMRIAMAEAELGDDVYGEDPTVNRLEQTAAAMIGQQAGLFVPSGTQSNLIGILCHCQRGDEYIAGQQAHTYRYEAGGAAVLGSIQPQPLEFEPDGTLNLERVASAIKPDDFHFARTRLLCLENTQGGKVLALDYLRSAANLAHQHGLKIHLDGARLFNAAVKQGVSPATIGGLFDSVSICLSKGLGAPVGSVLCGPQTLIDDARRWRKMVGGGMRQAGILAAAGLYALDHQVNRLAEDHTNAALLTRRLSEISALEERVDPASGETNMVFLNLEPAIANALAEHLRSHAIAISPAPRTRLVTHLNIDREAVETVAAHVAEFFAS